MLDEFDARLNCAYWVVSDIRTDDSDLENPNSRAGRAEEINTFIQQYP
jgi:hypothetical protein